MSRIIHSRRVWHNGWRVTHPTNDQRPTTNDQQSRSAHTAWVCLVLTLGLLFGVLVVLPGPAWLVAAPQAGWTPLDDTDGLVDFALAPRGQVSPTLYAATANASLTDGAIFTGTAGGPAWTDVLTGSPFIAVALNPVTPGLVYAGSFADLFWRSADGGVNWTQSITSLSTPGGSVFTILPTGATTLYVGTDDGVFLSDDGGGNWSLSGLDGSDVYALERDGGVLVAGTDAGTSRSLDDGVTWTAPTTDVAASDVSALLKSGRVLYAGTIDLAGGLANNGVYTSTDQADEWLFASTGLTTTAAPTAFLDVRALAASHRAPRVVIAATGEGVYVTGNWGQTWWPSKETLTGSAKSVWSLATAGLVFETVYAGTEAGVYSLPLFDLGCPALYANLDNTGASANAVTAADFTPIRTRWRTDSRAEDLDDSGLVDVRDLMIATGVWGCQCTP
jgi:photosystem II stability/assembly factor-like uncharacterized protein